MSYYAGLNTDGPAAVIPSCRLREKKRLRGQARSTAEMPGGATNEVAILGRLFLDGKAELTAVRARYLLEIEFSESDKDRMATLAMKNQEGRLSDAEREELLGYAKAGCLLGILHSRARRTIARSN